MSDGHQLDSKIYYRTSIVESTTVICNFSIEKMNESSI